MSDLTVDGATDRQDALQPDQQSQEQGRQEQTSHARDENCCSVLANKIGKLRRWAEYSGDRCIYRIPKLLRQTNEEAYTPVLVSIGPLHHKRIHNDERLLLEMEPHKLNYLRSFLGDPDPEDSNSINVSLQRYLDLVKAQEDKIRKCYADSTRHLDSEEFVEMVLTDGAFIIELLRKASSPAEEGVEDDPIWGHPHLLNEVLRDIMLAENQLPLFIIAELYETAFGSSSSTNGIDQLVLQFLRSYFVLTSADRDDDESSYVTRAHARATWHSSRPLLALLRSPAGDGRIRNGTALADQSSSGLCRRRCHLLDLLRSNFLTSGIGTDVHVGSHQIDIGQPPMKWMTKIPTATDLVEANVKFHGKQTPDWLNISFENGTLTIPKIIVGGRTESQFRNLIAFEQCHYQGTPFITDYVYFMDCLINTPQDVKVLVKANILENLLGSNADLSNMFNALCKNVNVAPHQDRYQTTAEQLNRHYNSRSNHYKAIFKSSFLAHPWAVISLICASLLLVLTISQAITGALSVPGALKGG